MKPILSLLFALAALSAFAGEGQKATWSTNASGAITLHVHRRLERPDGSKNVPCWNYAPPETIKAVFWCSNDHRIELGNYEIAKDGAVTPTIQCATAGCDFRATVKLEDWKR